MISEKKTIGGGVAAVDRAFQIIRAVQTSESPISLSELSRQTGLYKSTILRLLESLAHAAIVVQRIDLKYELGPFAFRLGQAFEKSFSLKEHVTSSLNRLVERGTESASFHLYYDENQRLCLYRVNSHHSTLDNVTAGNLLPLDRGAAGNVIRRYLSLGGKEISVESSPIIASFGERESSCAALACPIFGMDSHFAGALSLSGPRERFSENAVAQMSEILEEESKRLTILLGGRWPFSRAKAGFKAKAKASAKGAPTHA